MRLPESSGPLLAALATTALLLLPLVLAGVPRFRNDGFPGPYTRADAIVVFFVAVPLLFTALSAYHVARYYGVGVDPDERRD